MSLPLAVNIAAPAPASGGTGQRMPDQAKEPDRARARGAFSSELRKARGADAPQGGGSTARLAESSHKDAEPQTPRSAGEPERRFHESESGEAPDAAPTRNHGKSEENGAARLGDAAEETILDSAAGGERGAGGAVQGLLLAFAQPAEPQMNPEPPPIDLVTTPQSLAPTGERGAGLLLTAASIGADGSQANQPVHPMPVTGSKSVMQADPDLQQSVPRGASETRVTKDDWVEMAGLEGKPPLTTPKDQITVPHKPDIGGLAADQTDAQKRGVSTILSATPSKESLADLPPASAVAPEETIPIKEPPASESATLPVRPNADAPMPENEPPSDLAFARQGTSAQEARPEPPAVREDFSAPKQDIGDARHGKADHAADATPAVGSASPIPPAMGGQQTPAPNVRTMDTPSPAPSGLARTAPPPSEPVLPATARAVVFEVAQPDLGRVHVRVAMTQDLVHTHLSSDRSDVGQFLMNSHDRLQAALQAAGFELGQFRVDIDRQHGGRAFQQWPFQEQGGATHHQARTADHQTERPDWERSSSRSLLNLVA